MLSRWTSAEDRAFERALGTFFDDEEDKFEEDKFERIADALGRPPEEIREKYELLLLDIKNIEEGPAPYFIDDWFPEPVAKDSTNSQKNTKKTTPNQSEKKVLWTEEEHRKLLKGIAKHGKGEWKKISSEIVKTKTPTQIASHAQKLYLRLNGTPKRRKRASIHDLTIDDTDLVPQQNQVPQLNAPLQQNWVQLDAPMQQLSSQQNQADALDFPMQQLSFQQNGDPPLNFPHQVYPQQSSASPLNVQQLSYQQNGNPPMNFLMQQSQEIQQSDLASQQYLVPPLEVIQMQQRQEIQQSYLVSQQHMVPPLEVIPMQQLQEKQHTLGDNVLASQQHMVPPLDAPMQQLSSQQNQVDALDFPMQQNGDPLNFPHQVYPQQSSAPLLNVQQLSYQQNGHPPMNFLMQQSQEIQQSVLASQQYLVPPLDSPMQHMQERQHTLGDSVLASEQHVVPPSEVMPMQQLQERPKEHQAVNSRNFTWKTVGNHER